MMRVNQSDAMSVFAGLFCGPHAVFAEPGLPTVALGCLADAQSDWEDRLRRGYSSPVQRTPIEVVNQLLTCGCACDRPPGIRCAPKGRVSKCLITVGELTVTIGPVAACACVGHLLAYGNRNAAYTVGTSTAFFTIGQVDSLYRASKHS